MLIKKWSEPRFDIKCQIVQWLECYDKNRLSNFYTLIVTCDKDNHSLQNMVIESDTCERFIFVKGTKKNLFINGCKKDNKH